MQELLQMMQKITAEPNNNARVHGDSIAPPTSATDVDSSLEASSVDDARVAPDIVNTTSTEAQLETEPESESESESEPESESESESQAIVNIEAIQTENLVLTVSESDINVQRPEEFAVDDTITDKPADKAAHKLGGFVKRWISKAVSWVKRLIGY